MYSNLSEGATRGSVSGLTKVVQTDDIQDAGAPVYLLAAVVMDLGPGKVGQDFSGEAAWEFRKLRARFQGFRALAEMQVGLKGR
jgi:hypothetical protein